MPDSDNDKDVDYAAEDEHMESTQQASRRYILISYWIVIILAVPFWWTVTSIERLGIPEARVEQLAGRHLKIPLNMVIEAEATVCATLKDTLSNEMMARVRSRPERWGTLNIRFLDELPSDDSAYTIRLGICDERCSNGSYISVVGRELRYLTTSDSRDDTKEIINTLETLLTPPVSSVQAQYASRYRLAFSLLNEDSSTGGAVLDWDIDQAIKRYMTPLFRELSVLHNFTIETQVQYHAPLAFSPHENELENGSKEYRLDQDHLKTFVNSAEWSLASSVNNDIVLHFLLFVPSVEHRPLYVMRSEGERSTSNAFLTPQWGGIAVWNPPATDSNPDTSRINRHLDISMLAPVFSIFNSQLRSLLGVPPIPHTISHVSESNSRLSPWQLDALLRQRTVENVVGSTETLQSIVKLVHQIQSMPVRADVVKDVSDALDALDKAHSSSDLTQTLLHSSIASHLSSRAFFNPNMLAMLYFPAEHTFAVYTPLFLPVAVPLIAMTLKELLQERNRRKKKNSGEADVAVADVGRKGLLGRLFGGKGKVKTE